MPRFPPPSHRDPYFIKTEQLHFKQNVHTCEQYLSDITNLVLVFFLIYPNVSASMKHFLTRPVK